MTPATTHPLVAAWLRDLELMLHGVEPGERAEVLAGVHEHLDASLPPGASDDDVRRVLADLGSPGSVADEAYAGRPPLAPAPSRPGSRWTAVVATAINSLCLLLQLPMVVWGVADAVSILFGSTLLVLPWLTVCALSAVSTRWSPTEKARSILLLPASVVTMAVLMWITMSLIGSHPVNLVPTFAVLGTAAWVLVRLGRSALR